MHRQGQTRLNLSTPQRTESMSRSLNSNNREPPQLLTLAATAAAIGCSVRTLRRRIAARELPIIRDERLLRVDPEDLRRYLAARREA
jgi:hypothetical protein